MKWIFIILAMSGNFYNDVLALVSVIGTFFMLIGSMPGTSLRRMVAIGEWSLAAVFFGILFQVSMIMTDFIPEKIGFILPMQPALVTGLFVLSCLFLLGYWLLQRAHVKSKL